MYLFLRLGPQPPLQPWWYPFRGVGSGLEAEGWIVEPEFRLGLKLADAIGGG